MAKQIHVRDARATKKRTMQTANEVIDDDLNYICTTLADELKQMSGKRLLITGGAGFLGYYLVQTITHFNGVYPNQPIGLVVFDNFSRGVPVWLMRLEGLKALKLVRHDMREPLPQGMADFQYIVHAASIASPTYYRRDPIGTMDANVNGLRNLLDYALKQKETNKPIDGFLFFSSSEVYGDPDRANIPTREDYRGNVSFTGPRACYDEAKRYGETLCVNFAKQHDLPVKVARPFNNYGPGLKITDGRVLPDFVRDVLTGRDIVMLSDGSATRTFCYVADAVTGYFKALVRGHSGEAYNIGTETPEISVIELSQKLIDMASMLLDYQGKVIMKRSSDKEYLIDNPNRRCPIIAKARDHLGFNPTITIEEGLRRSLIWYNENRDAEER